MPSSPPAQPQSHWLLVGADPFHQLLAAHLVQSPAPSACLLTASNPLPPYTHQLLTRPAPTLLYGQAAHSSDTEMYVFQLLTNLTGPWRGVVCPVGPGSVFLAAYLARYLGLPLILRLTADWQQEQTDLLWSLQAPQVYLVGPTAQQAALRQTTQSEILGWLPLSSAPTQPNLSLWQTCLQKLSP